MDERYLYFAMADPDVFDVPWAAPDPDPVDVADLVPAAWGRREEGPWHLCRPPALSLPPAGWKVHVATTVEHAEGTLRELARACVALEVPFKVLRGHRLVRAGHLKYSPRSLSAKAGTAYPCDEDALVAVVTALEVGLAGMTAPAVPGDVDHATAPIGLRWGAFTGEWVEAPDGRVVPGVRSSDGAARHDDRLGAAPPLPARLAARFGPTPDEPLPVEDVAVLHRSNAGGVYRARLTANGRPVVLKEARHHTGLDGDGVDAVTRLHHERVALQALSGSGVAPEVVDLWRRADADFLVIEHVDGPNLATAIGRRHPDGIPWSTPADRVDHTRWAGAVVDELRDLVGRMRARGVLHGDLQPANIVVGPDGLRLVDFEGAVVGGHAVTGAIGTPGYVPMAGEARDRDTFAVDRIARVLSDPDALLLDRRPDLEPRLAGGSPSEDGPAADQWRRRLLDGVLARATPQRTDRLFPGGIEQFTRPLGGHDLASGAAGVLLALATSGHDVDPAHLDWLAGLPARSTSCRGLLEGVDGIALALARLGRPDAAARLAPGLLADAPRGLSWSRGRAGAAGALAELAGLLGDDRLASHAAALTRSVVADTLDDAAGPRSPGLLTGWAGVALGLLRAGELLDLDTGPAARAALHREIAALTPRGDCLVALPGGRVRTGLAHGSAATLLAIAALGPDRLDQHLADAAEPLRRTTTRSAAPVAGLLDGRAGEIAVLAATGTAPVLEELRERRERCTWHCVPTSRGWSTLGAQRLRCSDDLATGSAGVLLALADDPAAAVARALGLPQTLTGCRTVTAATAMTAVTPSR